MSNICSKCGKEIEEGKTFCGHCGTRVAVNVAVVLKPAEQQKEKSKASLAQARKEFLRANKKKISIISACVLSVVIVALTISMCVIFVGNKGFTYKRVDDSYEVTGTLWVNPKKLEIPAEHNGKPVTRIGNDAFQDCYNLTSVVIPDSVTSIAYDAFKYCSSLTSVTIPDSVTSIGEYAFYSCSSLTSVTIGDSVTSIGSHAFYNCSSLTEITIGDSVTSIGSDAFYHCPIEYASLPTTAISSIPDGKLKEVVITSGDSIGDWAFSYCDSLTSVTIGNSVTSIGSHAFEGCDTLTSVNYLGTIEDWCGITFDGFFANPLNNGATLYLNGELVTELVIPNGVTTIKDYAFSGYSITSVTIGNSVTSIGNSAFSSCSSLTSVTIGDSVTSIGDHAFYNCSSLTEIIIPDSVTSIGQYVFYNCDSLTSVTIGDSVTSIGSYAFDGCTNLTIYCEAESKPSGWHSGWNAYDNSNVVWGYQE